MYPGIRDKIELYSHKDLTRISTPYLLLSQLRYVLRKSVFYRSKFVGLPLFNESNILDLHDELPLTDKSELLDDQRKCPPFGNNLCINKSEGRRISRTSGMTGSPLLLVLTEEDIHNTYKCGTRCFWASGLRPQHVVVNCMNYCLWAGGYTDHGSLEAVGATVVPFGIGNSRLLVDFLLHVRPYAIHLTPSYLTRLKDVLEQDFHIDPSELGLKLGLLGGEGGLQSSIFREEIERTWGIRAMDANYGMSDVLSMFGAECQMRCGLHFMGQNVVYPTLIDPSTCKVIPVLKGACGELVLTNLRKEAQPLVRYRTHDIIEILDTERCQCGRGSFRFRVVGRSDDMVTVRGVNVWIGAIADLINEELKSFTGEYEVLVDKIDPISRFIVRVEVRKSCEDPGGVCCDLQSMLADKLFVRPDVELASEGSLSRTEGKIKRLFRIL